MKPTKKQIEVFHHFRGFYLQKHGGDYKKANFEMLNLQIHAIEVYSNIIIIKTGRPGLLIGPRGKNYDDLRIYLRQMLTPDFRKETHYTIHIVEVDSILNYLLYDGWQLDEPLGNEYPT